MATLHCGVCSSVIAPNGTCYYCKAHDERKAASQEKVNHPAHYGGDTTYEAIKVIEAWGLGFCLGNAVKYICRSGKKGDALEDLKKAAWYLQREIEAMQAMQRKQEGK